jgi:hypothetical protein
MVKNKRLKTHYSTLNVKQLPRFKKLALKEKTQQNFLILEA